MKVSYDGKVLTIRMNKWDYRIYITANYWWAGRRKIRCPDTFAWEDFNQTLIPKLVAKEAIKYWSHQVEQLREECN